jgi:hypothetical protein
MKARSAVPAPGSIQQNRECFVELERLANGSRTGIANVVVIKSVAM